MTEANASNGSIQVMQPPIANNPNTGELAAIERMATLLQQSGFCKGARNQQQAVALILMGREVGLPAMQALSMIHVIEGKPTASVHLMGALLARGGVSWQPTKHDVEGCEIEFVRPGWKTITARFSVKDAERAGLGSKDNWRKWPRNMMYARAFTEGARMIGPDLLCGLNHTPEELSPDMAVTEEGEPNLVGETIDYVISDKQRKRAWAMAKARGEKIGGDGEAILRAVCERYEIQSSKDIRRSQYETMCNDIENYELREPGDETDHA